MKREKKAQELGEGLAGEGLRAQCKNQMEVTIKYRLGKRSIESRIARKRRKHSG